MKRILFIGLLLCLPCSANVGYEEINLIDYKTNNYIHINSSISLTDYTYNFYTGVNWFGMPWNSTITNADSLIRDIPNHQNVKWWNGTSQTAEVYTSSPWGYYGDNFSVNPLGGYEVNVDAITNWTILCYNPIDPTIQYQCFNLNNYYGTNIIRVRNT